MSSEENDKGFPEIGFMRLKQILAIFPVGRSIWWAGVKDGTYPAPVKLSPRCTAWRVADIRKMIASYDLPKGEA